MPLLLYPFRYRDELTGKWVRARYKAEIEVIAERFEEWEIIGPPEERTPTPVGFNPHRQPSCYPGATPATIEKGLAIR